MAKQKFEIAHDIRFNGRHVPKGSSLELDARDGKDALTLHNLLSSNRIVDVEAAHKHIADANEDLAKAAKPGAVKVNPPVAPTETKPAEPKS